MLLGEGFILGADVFQKPLFSRLSSKGVTRQPLRDESLNNRFHQVAAHNWSLRRQRHFFTVSSIRLTIKSLFGPLIKFNFYFYVLFNFQFDIPFNE